ncbi:hypothetical protein B0T17DRAFT_588437 [Bombardia bombarda]|uniref:Nudix hydrolase domain-containing protein n=1 Tax=Bombardia bombarda TaxID=252184 RepID=A0AA39X7A7_9PEZI|nr:hypothetical protein B0T17DRAFT_588437 [Bombardia bombarda]
MSFNHPEHDIPVSLPMGLSAEQSWISTLQHSLHLQTQNASHPFHSDPYVLRSVTVQAYDLFGEKRVGFLKLVSDVSNGAGEKLPGAVFLRGPSVAMLVMLVPDDAPAETDERYVLLTVQPRIAAGSLEFAELPAGMVDEAGNFAGTAANEIREELGLEIPQEELINLSDMAFPAAAAAAAAATTEGKEKNENLPQAMFPSAGGCDEYIPIFMHERRVPREQLGEWTGRLTGLREHGEKITLKLVRMRDLWREGARDAKCLAALALWEGLRREGRL